MDADTKAYFDGMVAEILTDRLDAMDRRLDAMESRLDAMTERRLVA